LGTGGTAYPHPRYDEKGTHGAKGRIILGSSLPERGRAKAGGVGKKTLGFKGEVGKKGLDWGVLGLAREGGQ